MNYSALTRYAWTFLCLTFAFVVLMQDPGANDPQAASIIAERGESFGFGAKLIALGFVFMFWAIPLAAIQFAARLIRGGK